MKCPICKHGETEPGYATVILERQKTTLVFKRVPANVCNKGYRKFYYPIRNRDTSTPK